MNKIVLKHSSIIINNYNIGDCPRLENYFRIYDMITHSYYYKGIEYIPEEKKLILPRGLDVYFLERLFNEKAIVDTKCDPYEIIDEIRIKYLPRDDVQKEALKFMVGKQPYHENMNKSQLSVNLNTGKGKTYCSIATAIMLRMRSVIITSSLDWLDQWRNCILEYTDTKPKEIYLISGVVSIQKLLQRGPERYKFILASHDTIKSYGDNNGWDKVSELFKIMKVGLKFYDEAHLRFDNMCKIDYYTNTFRTYYVTATPARSSEDENNIYQLFMKNIPAINLFDEDNDPHTRYVSFKYNSIPTASEISECRNQYGLDRNKYTSYVVRKEYFYRLLRVLMDLVLYKPGKTLIYIGTNAAINVVKDWLELNYPELINHIGVYTSATPKDIKESQLNKKIILSTTKSCGAAMDIKGLRNTIVLAEPFKSEVLARQTLGRTRDDNTNYFEVVDYGFDRIRKFYNYKKPIFDKYATSCSEVSLSKAELYARSNFLEESAKAAFEKVVIMKRLDPNETIKPGTYFGGPEYKKQQILFRLDDNGELI